VKKKFALPKFGEVSKIRLEHSSSSNPNQRVSRNSMSLQSSQVEVKENNFNTGKHPASSLDDEQCPQMID